MNTQIGEMVKTMNTFTGGGFAIVLGEKNGRVIVASTKDGHTTHEKPSSLLVKSQLAPHTTQFSSSQLGACMFQQATEKFNAEWATRLASAFTNVVQIVPVGGVA